MVENARGRLNMYESGAKQALDLEFVARLLGFGGLF